MASKENLQGQIEALEWVVLHFDYGTLRNGECVYIVDEKGLFDKKEDLKARLVEIDSRRELEHIPHYTKDGEEL